MSITTPSSSRPSFRFAWPGEKVAMAILLVVFFALHVLAGALLESHAKTGAVPTREAARISLHD